MGKIFQVLVRGFTGNEMVVDLVNTDEQFKKLSVKQLHDKIQEKINSGTDIVFRMLFATTTLDDDSKLLHEYGIQHMSVIHLVVRLPGGSTP